MHPTIHLSLDALDTVAPFALQLALDGTIERVGPSLAILCGDVHEGDALFSRLAAATAGMRDEIAELSARVGSVVALQHRASGRVLRGTIVSANEGQVLLFIGTPVFESAEELAASGLTELDFAPGDQTFDAFARLAAALPARTVAPDGLIDAVQLERLTGIPGQNRPTLAGDLLEVFTTRFVRSLDAVRDAARAQDPVRVRHEAHAFKGSALTVGAAAVGLVSGRIEDDARDGKLDQIEERCASIESLWVDTAPYLWQIVERRAPR